ncbi:hypothetical protein Tco_1167316 [Tanacetum coccineum]
MESNDGAIPCESNLFQEILLKMNLPDHRIKQRWRWRHLVPVESIHHPMLTLNASKSEGINLLLMAKVSAARLTLMSPGLLLGNAVEDTLKITKHNLIIHSQNSTSMAALKFIDSHNVVAFLEKPTESSGFEEIVDFLNAHPIRKDLQFVDEDGIDCLPNTTIFYNQIDGCLSPKKSAWNEYSSNIAAAIIYEAILKDRGESLERAATTASSLEAEQVSGNILKTQSKVTLNEPNPQGNGSGVNTPQSDEDSMKLKELMEFCTKLQQRVLNLENTKTTQA